MAAFEVPGRARTQVTMRAPLPASRTPPDPGPPEAIEVIGLCRFSWPGEGGFQIRHDSLAARRAHLYAPTRLADRLRIFEAFTLPALRAQTDPDFTLLVVIGPDLPAPARQRLEGLLAALPQAVIAAHPPGPHRQVMREAVNAVRRHPDRPCAQFRMDDDDAVARSFVARLRQAAAVLRALPQARRWGAVDFTRGWLATPGPQGMRGAELALRGVSAGLGIVFGPGVPRGVLDFAHHRLWEHMPTLSLTEPDMFLRGIDGHNDSDAAEALRRHPVAPLDGAARARLQAAFAIDPDRVAALHAAPRP